MSDTTEPTEPKEISEGEGEESLLQLLMGDLGFKVNLQEEVKEFMTNMGAESLDSVVSAKEEPEAAPLSETIRTLVKQYIVDAIAVKTDGAQDFLIAIGFTEDDLVMLERVVDGVPTDADKAAMPTLIAKFPLVLERLQGIYAQILRGVALAQMMCCGSGMLRLQIQQDMSTILTQTTIMILLQQELAKFA